jgi:hypothetical protein
MMHEIAKSRQTPIMTFLSLTLTIGGNLVAWIILVWTFITAPSAALFEYIPLVITSFLLLFINIIGLFVALIATWRKEPKIRLRRTAYVVSLVSFPTYLLVTIVLL